MRVLSVVAAAFLSCHVAAFSHVPLGTRHVRSSTELYGVKDFFKKKAQDEEEADICIVGGGVSGLTAAITAAQELKDAKIVLLEASPTLGGRVQTDEKDGFLLDRGFAVFIENYPIVQELDEKGILNLDKLKLGRFLPGSLIKIPGRNELARVVDPIRDPGEVFNALLAPVGSIGDKVNVLRLVIFTFQNSVEDLFKEPETDTLSCLESKWSFEEDFIDKFFKPFLEGIYLAPLAEQSSRMFYFIWKMFSEGAASLPEGGIGAVAKQLVDSANSTGSVELRCGEAVQKIHNEDDGFYRVECADTTIKTKSLVVATDGQVAQKLLSGIEGFYSLQELPETPQREVACLYYAFDTPVPVTDPVLVLSGRGELRGTGQHPVNNVCFPSVVNKAYAPEGSNLCSVTVLSNAIEQYRDKEEELDKAVREELCTWFPERAVDIRESWELKGFYDIPKAQPAQYGGPFPANVNGGRDCTSYRGKVLPEGLVVCGDHMATATLNGALESGLNAGKVAAKHAQQVMKKSSP